MTVSYTAEVATCRGFGCFLKLLLRWKASVYKLIWTDLLLFLTLYYCLSGMYRMVLEDDQKIVFEKVVEFCRKHTSSSPLSFVLGFYVTIVMNRWWNQYISIPWPDSIAVFVSATIHGNDERGRLMRRTIVRYVCVCLTLVLANVSPRVKKRFPTLEHYVDAGLILENELAIFQSLNSKFPKPSKHWLPIVWASSIVTRARKEGRIRDDFAVKTLIDELNKFRGSCGSLVHYDTISIPLVYTQVVTIAVYTYFLINIIGQQWINEEPDAVDIYFPIFTTLEIFFYMGWLKVAETLINPFGEDDDDFEVNWIVDRNLQVSYLIVDEMHHEHPELIRDQYWDEVFPTELPYTAAAQPFREEHPEPSTAGIQLSAAQQELQPSSVRIDEMAKEYEQKYGMGENDDAISGLNFEVKVSRSGSRISNKDRIVSGGSVASNIGGSFRRINSVSEIIDKCKKVFMNKEDRPDGTKTPGGLPNSTSAASLRIPGGGGSMRIGTIQELDEQLTMTSIRPEHRPHVQDIFPQTGPPPASAPVDVPRSSNAHRNIDILSTSAPTNCFISSSGESASNSATNASKKRYNHTRERHRFYRNPSFPAGHNSSQLLRHLDKYRYKQRHSYKHIDRLNTTQMSAPLGNNFDPLSFANRDNNYTTRSCSSSRTNSVEEDEFEKLKTERSKQRLEKLTRKLSVNNRAALEPPSLDMEDSVSLLSELANASRGSFMQQTSNDRTDDL